MLREKRMNRTNIGDVHKPHPLIRFTSILVGLSFLLGLFSNSVFGAFPESQGDYDNDQTVLVNEKSDQPFDHSKDFPLENTEDSESTEDSELLEESSLEKERGHHFFQSLTSTITLCSKANALNKLRLVCAYDSLISRSNRSLVLLLHSWKIPHS